MTAYARKRSKPTFQGAMEALLDLIECKPKLLIVDHLYGERRRLGDLRRPVGTISEKMLSNN
jgi:DNA-binding HxlR family transcriptional regulator